MLASSIILRYHVQTFENKTILYSRTNNCIELYMINMTNFLKNHCSTTGGYSVRGRKKKNSKLLNFCLHEGKKNWFTKALYWRRGDIVDILKNLIKIFS